MNWHWSWTQAAALAAAVALAVQLLQGLVEVSCETLTFTPGQGARFEARRRCRLNKEMRVVPRSRVDCAIIHEASRCVLQGCSQAGRRLRWQCDAALVL